MFHRVFLNKRWMIDLLIVSSILMFCSLFSGNAKIAGTGLTLWVIVVFWNMYLVLRNNRMGFGDLTIEVEKRYDAAKAQNKIGERLLYGVTIPMIFIGLAMVVVILVTFFTVL